MRARTLSGCWRVPLRVGNAGSPRPTGIVEPVLGQVLAQQRARAGSMRSPASVFVAVAGRAAARREVEVVGRRARRTRRCAGRRGSASRRRRAAARRCGCGVRRVRSRARRGGPCRSACRRRRARGRARRPRRSDARISATFSQVSPRCSASIRSAARSSAAICSSSRKERRRPLGLRCGGLQVRKLAGEDAALLGVAQDALGGVERPPDRRVRDASPARLVARARSRV